MIYRKKRQNSLFADNHLLDKFYLEFENKFRGSEETIRKNVEFYAELFKRADLDYEKHPILDIGCGRGELLSVLLRYHLNARGIDINREMVKHSRAVGFDVKQADAVKYLSGLSPRSLGGIVGIHIIEHIPFESLLLLFESAYKVLIKKGIATFETPNPENLMVASYGFYMDPSHLHPLPAPLIEHALLTVGFSSVEIVYRHDAARRTKKYSDKLLRDLYNKVRGPQDYTVIAHKE